MVPVGRMVKICLATLGVIVLLPSTASAAPPTPQFGPAIDDYSRYQPPGCEPTAKPGVIEFRDLLNQTYGNHRTGIVRACDVGGASEHKEGRALDYHFNITNPEDAAEANDVLNWLLASDRYGNSHAMARRLGIMYIIWNRQIWESYRQHLGWQQYTGPIPHTDHIHFSFSWAGARQQTTWWTARLSGRSDVNGDGRDDLVTLQDGELKWWASYGTGAPLSSNWAAGTQMTTADVNGDGRDDLVTLQDGVLTWWAGFGPGRILSRGWADGTQITAGDVNGDGRDDLVTLRGGVLEWWPGFGTAITLSDGWSEGTQITTADVNGDGRDDLVTLQGEVLKWWPGFGTGIMLSDGWDEGTQITTGDVNGDGRSDLVTLQGEELKWWPGFGTGVTLSSGWPTGTTIAS